MRLLARLDQTGAGVSALDHRQQVLDQCISMARVPLQNALKARMFEVGQRPVDLCTQLAKPDHDVTSQMRDMPQ